VLPGIASAHDVALIVRGVVASSADLRPILHYENEEFPEVGKLIAVRAKFLIL
jgi:hypothetical protein